MPKCDLSIRWVVSASLLAIASSTSVIDTALAAAACIQSPDRQADPGSHWYYRIDHVNHRRCWYLKKSEVSGSSAAAPAPVASPNVASPNTDKPPTVLSWISSLVGAVAGPSSPGPEEAAATRNSTSAPATQKTIRRRGPQNARRFDSEPVASQKPPQQSSPQRSEEPSAALPFDTARRETLFREFMQWRERKLLFLEEPQP